MTTHPSYSYYPANGQPSQGQRSQAPPPMQANPTYHNPHDPRYTVHQTNQTLTALDTARRLGPEYANDQPNVYSPSHHSMLSQPTGNYYSMPQQPPPTERYYPGGHASENAYGVRPVQNPPSGQPSSANHLSPPATSTSSRSSEGHACNFCGKAFGRPSALQIHMAIHTGERAYTCPEESCHRSFSVKSNLTRHLRNVHQIWPEGHHGDVDSGEDDRRRAH